MEYVRIYALEMAYLGPLKQSETPRAFRKSLPDIAHHNYGG
jgi:hypothetical protein